MFLTDFSSVFETMLYTGLAGLALAAVLYFVFWIFTKNKLKASLSTHILRYIFITYLICVLLLTWTSENARPNLGANFAPLSSIFYALRSGFETAQILILLNVLMFVPMGLFLPLVFTKIDTLWKAILVCFGATLLIETVQSLLPGRAFDIDDILMNTLGGAIGFSLYTIAFWIRKQPKLTLATRLSAICVLLIIPVFLGAVSLLDAKEFRYTFGYRLHLPKEMGLIEQSGNYPQTAPIYIKDAPPDAYDLMVELQSRFDITGKVEDFGSTITCIDDKRQISVFTDSADWHYTLRETNNTPCTFPETELIAQAQTFMKNHSLWDEAFILESIYDMETDTRIDIGAEDLATVYEESNKPDYIKITGKIVTYTLNTNEKIAYATICFDENGIYEIQLYTQTYSVYQDAPLLSPEEALSALSRTGNCGFYADIFEPESATFTKATLAYTDSIDQTYRLPTWKLFGTFYGKDVAGQPKEESGYMLVEALKQ